MSLEDPSPDFGGELRSSSVPESTSSGFEEVPLSPRSRRLQGPSWNLEQTQNCLREIRSEVEGEDPMFGSPTRNGATADRVNIHRRPEPALP